MAAFGSITKRPCPMHCSVTAVERRARRLRQTGRTTLVGGDFNARPESRVVAVMEEGGWRDAWEACARGGSEEGERRAEPEGGLTYPAGAPDRRIDYLFIPPELECRSARVLERDASPPAACPWGTPRPVI